MHFYVYTNNIWMPLDVGREERLNCKANTVRQTGYWFSPICRFMSHRHFCNSRLLSLLCFWRIISSLVSVDCLIKKFISDEKDVCLKVCCCFGCFLCWKLNALLPNVTWSSSLHNSLNLPLTVNKLLIIVKLCLTGRCQESSRWEFEPFLNSTK